MLSYQRNPIKTYHWASRLNKNHPGMIVILVGAQAETLEPVFDRTKHDVRSCEPYFYPDDPVEWRLI